ncbi:hypothetical protein FJZ33_02325 [Candidatus Poribacteria bacterium]|nr:hypothetical protein [Candidatus Poribacteria bacterium]
MKCFVLGDSHIGALRSSIDNFGLPSGIEEVTFYAGPSASMADLAVRDGNLIPTSEKLSRMLSYTSGGNPFIDFKSADIIVIHGLSLSISVCSRILDKNTIEGGQSQSLNYITLACLSQAIADNLQRRLAIHVLKMVRQVTNKPIFLSQTPFPDARINNLKDKRWDFLKLDYKEGLYHAFNDGIKITSNKYGVKSIPQPECTLVDHIYTDSMFSKDSQGLAGGIHDESDFGHMNQHYGSLVWGGIIACL